MKASMGEEFQCQISDQNLVFCSFHTKIWVLAWNSSHWDATFWWKNSVIILVKFLINLKFKLIGSELTMYIKIIWALVLTND